MPGGSLRRGFSLLELIASLAILVIIAAILGHAVFHTQEATRVTAAREEAETSCSAAFAFLRRELSNAYVSTNHIFYFMTDGLDTDLVFHSISIPSRPAEQRAIHAVHLFSCTNGNNLRAVRVARKTIRAGEEWSEDKALDWAFTNKLSWIVEDVPILIDNVYVPTFGFEQICGLSEGEERMSCEEREARGIKIKADGEYFKNDDELSELNPSLFALMMRFIVLPEDAARRFSGISGEEDAQNYAIANGVRLQTKIPLANLIGSEEIR